MKRRGSQDGSLMVRGNSWIVAYRRHVIDENGGIAYKPTMKSVGRCNGPKRISRKQAQAEADRVVAEANALAAAPRQIASIRQFVDGYWWPDRSPKWRKSTQDFYKLMKGHFLPSLGDLPLKDVTPAFVQALLDAKAEQGLSKRTVRGIRDALTGVYKYARRKGFWKGALPTEGAEANGTEEQVQQSLTQEAAQILIGYMTPKYRPLVIFLRATAVRIGEAMGLRWKWVNLTDDDKIVDGIHLPPNSIVIVQHYTRGRWGPPKTARSRRTIPLSTKARAALLEMRERDITGGDDDPIFRGRTGEPLDAHNLASRHLKPAAKKAGVPWVHWHTFRHSLNGVDHITRKKVLGHTKDETTERYTHPDIEDSRKQLEQVQ